MRHLRQIFLIVLVTMTLSSIAHANAGPAILLRFGFHLVFLTLIIGLGEGLFLCVLLRAWRFRSWKYWKHRIYAMIGANITSAWLGMMFVNSRYAAQIMGDVTIENLLPAFWTMVYVTFVLTMIIEFPFFLFALYGQKWLIPKAATATLLTHCISYTLLFGFYRGEESMNMVTELEVVPASAFEVKEDYDLYCISPDRKNVLRSDLAGNDKEVVAALDMDGVPDRLCACPRKVTEEKQEGTDKKSNKTIQRVCWESGFDLYVRVHNKRKSKKTLLLEIIGTVTYIFDDATRICYTFPMPRASRIVVPDVPHHIRQRGIINRPYFLLTTTNASISIGCSPGAHAVGFGWKGAA